MQAGSCTFLFSCIYMHSFLFSWSCEWARMCLCVILYLNFYESHTHTYTHGRCQTIIFVRSFMSSFWFILHTKSRSSLYIRFSIIHIYSVQLSTKYKSCIHTHMHICILICLKLEIENWKIVITPSVLEISSILYFLTHAYIWSHCKRTSEKERERKKKEKKIVKRWTLSEKKKRRKKPPTSCECRANAHKSYIVQWEVK